MKVHLIKTPEYEKENFIEVYKFLSSFKGKIKFILSNHEFSIHDFDFLDLDFLNLGNQPGRHDSIYNSIYNSRYNTFIPSLSWEQLFSICKQYRKQFQIEAEDFVVLLTTRNNALNWFSHFDSGRNIFAHTSVWESLAKVHHKYPVAYQVVENILQALLNMPFADFYKENVHENPRGCFNDFCKSKEQVLLKLQTANICPDCAEKMQLQNINPQLIDQALKIFEEVRKKFLFNPKSTPTAAPTSLIINEESQVLLPEHQLEICLTPLYKTLYVFYLKHPEGVRLNELSGHKAELQALYKKLSKADSNGKIEKSITHLVNPMEGSFSQKKSKINKKINELLGEPLAKFYRIEGERGTPFKINLPPRLIELPPHLIEIND